MELMLFRGPRFIDSVSIDKEMIPLGGYIGKLSHHLRMKHTGVIGEAAVGCRYYVGDRHVIQHLIAKYSSVEGA